MGEKLGRSPSAETKEEKNKSEIKESDIAKKRDLEDGKAKINEETREAALKEARRDSEEITKKMAEIEAKLKAEEEAKTLAAKSQVEERKKIVVTSIKKEEEQHSGMLEITEQKLTTKEKKRNFPQQTNMAEDLPENSPFSTQEFADNFLSNRNGGKDREGVVSKPIRSPIDQGEASIQIKRQVADNKDEFALVKEEVTSSGKEKDELRTSIEPISTQLNQIEDVDNGERDTRETPSCKVTTPKGLSFAQAFNSKNLPLEPDHSPMITLTSSSKGSFASIQEAASIPDPQLTPNSAASHSALSAARNKKASGLISKYEEKVAHSPLPGDSILIKRAKGPAFSSSISPGSEQIIKEKTAATTA